MNIPTPPANFKAPWHGQAFALAVTLNEAGVFGWPEWTQAFGESLDTMRKDTPLDGSDDYYTAWIATLERILCDRDVVAADALAQMKKNWAEAFNTTPHGNPVKPKMAGE
jgi:nitrile hydratase accessory protein